MDPARWEKVKDLFALGEEMTPAEREVLLGQEPDAEVRNEARRLLDINPERAMIDQPVMSPRYLDPFANAGRAALLTEGEMLGTRYKIGKRIASGGMGDVYSAYDRDLKEHVAIKTIRPDIISNPAIVSRFRREIALARRVSHRNVCRVFDLSQDVRSSDGRMVDFLTMELVEGETLAQFLKREAPVGFEVARPLLEQICEGLAAAHEAGVVHRDFKGSNVLLAKRPDGSLRAAVTDFGLARSVALDGQSHESSTGLAGGTPAYMAPEQMEGRSVGPKADLYALGIVMYEMATGVPPHTGDSPLQIAVRRVTEKPQAPRTVNPDIDPRWEEAILRCLEYKPEDRPADARAVAEILRGGGASSSTRKLSIEVPKWKAPKWLWPALGGAAAVAAVVGWMWMRPPQHSPEAERWYRTGTNSLMDGSYSTARNAFEQALRIESGYGMARGRLADTLYELDQLEDARREIGKASSNDASERMQIESTKLALTGKLQEAIDRAAERARKWPTAESLLDHARLLDRAGRSRDAAEAYRAVLAKDGSLPGVHLRLAVVLRASGQATEADAELDKAEQLFAGNVEGQAALKLARAVAATKMADAAQLAQDAARLAETAKSDTLQVRAAFQKMVFVARGGDLASAEELGARAIELAKAKGQSSFVVGLREMAYLPYLRRDFKKAAEGYRAALDVAEQGDYRRWMADLKRRLGDTVGRDNQPDLGRRYLEEARQFHETNGEALEALTDRLLAADIFSYQNQHEAAMAQHRELLAEGMRTPGGERFVQRVRSSLLMGLFQRGEYPEALRLAQEGLVYYQKTGERVLEMWIRLRVAGALRHLGRFAEAQSALQPVLEDVAGPNHPEALDQQMMLWRDSGEIGKAIAAAQEKYRKASPKDTEDAARSMCNVYSLTSQIEMAEKWCLPLVNATSDNYAGNFLATIFRLQAARGKWKEAQATARKLLDWVGKHPDPENRLLAHLMLVAASSEGGRKSAPPDAVDALRRERGALEERWGIDNVKGMMSLPAFAQMMGR